MNEHLTTVSAEERRAFAKALDTLRYRYNTALANLAKRPVPPTPNLFETHGTKAWLLQADVDFLRGILEDLKPVFERVADDAAAHCNVRVEDFGLIENALLEFTAPLTNAVEEQIEAMAERRAER